MEASNHFTCLSYDTVDFLIQSKYVLFGIHLQADDSKNNILFESELLPYISIGPYLETYFSCKPVDESHVMLVMNKNDFNPEVRKLIVEYTNTQFPVSGSIAISVNTSVSSKIMDISALKPIPQGIRTKQKKCGICAIGFIDDENEPGGQRKQILISLDNLLRMFLKGGHEDSKRGAK